MKKLLLSTIAILGITSCAIVPSETGMTLVGEMKTPITATSNISANKTGKSCSKNILGLVGIGDSSIEKAKKNGRITRVSSVDKEIKAYLVYAEVCTIVKGN